MTPHLNKKKKHNPLSFLPRAFAKVGVVIFILAWLANFSVTEVRANNEVTQTTGEQAVNIVNPNDSENDTFNARASSGTLSECNFRSADGAVRDGTGGAFEECLGQIFQFIVVVAILLILFRIALSALKAYNPVDGGGSATNNAVVIVRDIVLGLLFIGGPYLILSTLNPALTNFDIADLSGVFSNIEQSEQDQAARRAQETADVTTRRQGEIDEEQAGVEQRLAEIDEARIRRLAQIEEDERLRLAKIEEDLRKEQEEAQRLADEEAQRLADEEAQRRADEAEKAARDLAQKEKEEAEKAAAEEAEKLLQQEEEERIEKERQQAEIDTAVDILNRYDITVNQQPVTQDNLSEGIEALEEQLWLYHRCHYLVLSGSDTASCWLWNLIPENRKADLIQAEKEFLASNIELVNEYNPGIGNHERVLTDDVWAQVPVKIIEDGSRNRIANTTPSFCKELYLILLPENEDNYVARIDQGDVIGRRTYTTFVCGGQSKPQTTWFKYNADTFKWEFNPLQSVFGAGTRADGTVIPEQIPDVEYYQPSS